MKLDREIPLLRIILVLVAISSLLLGWSSIHFDAAAEEAREELSSDRLDPPGPYKVFIPLVIQPEGVPQELEVTQGVQLPDNGVPLVADRTTYARSTVTSQIPHENVSARLYAYRDGSALPNSPLEAMNNPRTLKPTADRDVLDDTFNFQLPSSWLHGDVTISGYASNGTSFAEFSSPELFTFVETESLHVTIVPIAYTCTSGGSGTVTPSTPYDYLTDFTYRVYPVPSVNTTTHASMSYNGPCTSGMPDPTYNLDGSGDWRNILDGITWLWLTEGTPDSYYYGLLDVYCGGSCVSGIGWIGSRKAAVGFTGIGASHTYASDTHAHEVGHNHGRRHVPGCGASGVDPVYPYALGKIGDIDHQNYGFDISRLDLESYMSFYDMMGYCDPVWISDYTYEALMVQHIAPDGVAAQASAGGGSLLVSGNIEPGFSATINPAFNLDIPPEIPSPGPYTLELLDGDGDILKSYPFEGVQAHVDRINGSPSEDFIGFNLAVPEEPGVAEMRVQQNDVILGEKRARVMPEVSSMAIPDQLGGNLLPGELLHFGEGSMIRISMDNGATWQTIAINHRPSTSDLDLSRFKGSEVLVEIHISNGVGSKAFQFGPLNIP